MALYILAYDERTPSHDYRPLYAQLDNWHAAQLQMSVWSASIDDKAVDVLNTLLRHLHSDDTAVVIELKAGAEWATQGLQTEETDWLRQHLLM